MHDQYIFSGSLPENASTYVKRQADDELYEALLQGKFCYVLNSRQSGKSSLRVRTMSRLSEADVECATIDLSSISIQTATHENWYADLIVKLIDSFVLDIDFKSWWEQNQLNSPLLRFGNFLTKILLSEISENIVIFIDEIDSVLSLKFPKDDFFAFIRSCYNLRVNNPQYNRLTFCLLGVASPTSLIQDKNRTPFNIGQAISLKGFQLHEVEPLEKGLYGKFNNPQAIMQKILQWTGGQPFLTQKLCQFMVEESEQDNPRSVEQVVRSRMIENWESQDEPEHLRTIQARILQDEQRAGYLLELYQQIRLHSEQSEITADDTSEQSELQLSGLVVRQQNKLKVYNSIYQEVFDSNWIENQLKNLRPYSENFRFWVASGGADESRLLRGRTLQSALEWAKDKSLNYQDRQFLAASQAKEKEDEIAATEKEAALERERKDREAAEKRTLVLASANQKLAEANRKAQKRIRIGSVILGLTLVGAVFSIIWAGKDIQEIRNTTEQISTLSKLGEELHRKGKVLEASRAREQIGLAYEIRDYEFKKAVLLTFISQAYERLENWDEAESAIKESLDILKNHANNSNFDERLQIQVLAQTVKGNLLVQKKETNQAIEYYKRAFNLLKNSSRKTSSFTKTNGLLADQDVESSVLSLIRLLSKNNTELELRKQAEQFLPPNFPEYASFSRLPCDNEQQLFSPPTPTGKPDWQTSIYIYYGQINPITKEANGRGLIIFKNVGFQYYGDFKNNKRHGCGRLTYPKESNIQYYLGQFKDDYYQGLGRLKWKNQNEYRGNFVQNRCKGQGVYVFADKTKPKQSGIWDENKLKVEGNENLSCNK
ncbi:TPR repeat-containing protein (plasmid) [Calothrix brevissima NIES-22]|nr:TPR repeat-containing protein [Calothrix brevissima NIES-22]